MFPPRSSLDSPAPSQLPSLPCASLDLPCSSQAPVSMLPRLPAISSASAVPSHPPSTSSCSPSPQLDPRITTSLPPTPRTPCRLSVASLPGILLFFFFFFLRSRTYYNFSLIKRLRASSLALWLLLLAWVCPRVHTPGYTITGILFFLYNRLIPAGILQVCIISYTGLNVML